MAEQAGLCLTCSQTPKIGVLLTWIKAVMVIVNVHILERLHHITAEAITSFYFSCKRVFDKELPIIAK